MTPLAEEYRRRAAEDHDINAQMPVLYAWACHAKVIIELGVRGGNSTCAFLAGLERGAASRPQADRRYFYDALASVPELAGQGFEDLAALADLLVRQPGQLWSVDVEQPQVPDWWGRVQFWHPLVADDTSAEAVAHCPENADILFIDTSHYYPHTLQELRLYVPKVRPGGVVLLHDTDRAEWPDVGRSLDEFCGETGLTWYSHDFWHGLGVIEVPA